MPSISRYGIDRISQLPDHIIYDILFQLKTKQSVKTSVLSTRWRYLWKHVPGLDLSYYGFGYHAPEDFVDRFLGFDKESFIFQFKLHCGDRLSFVNKSYYKKWMKILAIRGIQNLVIDGSTQKKCVEVPVSICMCETLVHLKLAYAEFESFDSVSLPCLKTMHLEMVSFPNDESLERLISSSPVLRGLNFEGIHNVKVIRVRSQTLKRLSVKFINYVDPRLRCGLLIDAPGLKDLCLGQCETLVLESVGSSMKVDMDFAIDYGLLKTEMWRNFLVGISIGVADLTVSRSTLAAMYHYSVFVPLPEFPNLTRLCVTLKWLPCFGSETLLSVLASCPNLTSLYLDPGYLDMEKIRRSHVPKCMLTSLEFVEITSSIEEKTCHTELVEYMLGNAAILKKLVLSLCFCSAHDKCLLLEQLILLPRRSSACQVYVL